MLDACEALNLNYFVMEITCDEKGKPVDGIYREVSPATERLIGKKREQTIGKSGREFFGDADDFPTKFYEVIKTGRPIHFQSLGAALNKHYDVYAWKISNSQVVAIVNDITEDKRAENKVQSLLRSVEEQRDKFDLLLNSIPDEIWVADKNRKITLANPSAVKEFGLNTLSTNDVEKIAGSFEVYRSDGSPRPVEEAPPLRQT
jgi:PAS domain-containing protein